MSSLNLASGNLMRRLGGVAFLGALSLCVSAVQPLQAAPYVVDGAKSQVVVQVFKEGVASGLAHDHVIQATQLSGNVEYDPANLATATINMEAKTGSLKVDDPALRKQYKLTSELSESDREQVTTNMKSEDQLNVARYPTITFKSTAIKAGASATDVSVTGNLTIRGVTKAVTFPAKVKMDGQNFVGEGRVKIKQTDFGYEPYSALLGAIKNQNEVILNIKVVAHP